MSTREILSAIRPGATLLDTCRALQGLSVDGHSAQLSVEPRCVPYLKHVIAGVTDGPMAGGVEAVISAQEPGHSHWRRFTLVRERPGHYRLNAFPTPFNNATAPLSPGIPPSASRPGQLA